MITVKKFGHRSKQESHGRIEYEYVDTTRQTRVPFEAHERSDRGLDPKHEEVKVDGGDEEPQAKCTIERDSEEDQESRDFEAIEADRVASREA